MRDVLEHHCRLCLIVDGIEHRDQIVRLGLVERGHIELLETGVGQGHPRRLFPGPADPLLREVIAREPAVRVGPRHQIDGVSAAAADIGDVDARLQTIDKAGNERQDGVDELVIVHGSAGLRHHPVEVPVFRVRNPAAVAEGLDELALHQSHQRNELRENRHVVRTGGTGQEGGVLRRQPVGLLFRVVLDDGAGYHGPEPLTHIALVQPGRLGNLVAGGGRQIGHGVEQTGLMAHARHQSQHAVVQDAQHLLREGVRLHLIDIDSHQCNLLVSRQGHGIVIWMKPLH